MRREVSRVLIYAPSSRGGLAEHSRYQASELARRGLDVRVLCRPDFPNESQGYRRLPRLTLFRGNALALRITRALGDVVDPYILACYVAWLRPWFVLTEANSEYRAPFWFLPHWVLARAGVPYVTNFHDPVRKRFRGPGWWHTLSVRLAYAPLRGGLIHSPVPAEARFPARFVIREAPFGQFAALRGNIPAFDLRERLNIAAQAFVVLSFGHVADRKNLDRLIAALARLPDAVLVVAGSVVSSSDRPVAFYRELAADAGVADRVRFVEGFVPEEEVSAYFHSADMVALTYERQFVSQSGVLQIAALYDTPVLASGGDGPLRADVGRFGLGVTIEPDSAEAIVEGVCRLRAMATDFARNFARYRDGMSWEANIDALLDVVAAVDRPSSPSKAAIPAR